jgi:hypothetical protein
MSKLVYLCLGIILLAAQWGCGGGAASNANGKLAGDNPAGVNPNAADPNNPNVPPNVNSAPGGPIAQDPTKRGKPGLDQPPQIAQAPADSSGLSFSSMDFHGALLRGSKDQLTVLVADDFKGTMLDGSVQNKTQLLAGLKPSDQMFSANVQPPKVTGNSATILGTISMMGAGADPKNSKPGPEIKFTDTWQKRGNKWLITGTTITK